MSQVVSDYDRTMTKQHVEGEWNLSSFGTFTLHDPLKVTVAEREDDNYQFSGIFEQSKLLPNEVKEECKRMLKKYRPMEVDESLPMSKRIKAMEEWMEGSRDVIKGVEYPLDELDNVVEIYGSEMRDNIHDLFEKFEKLKVPVLVFSAGLGDVIKVMLKKNNMDFENIEIISNFLKYKGDVIQGFVNEKMIHVFNKNEHAIEDKDYFQYLKNKHNALLMGDTTGDAAMTDGIDTLDVVLKIGFLYEEVSHVRLQDSYEGTFSLIVQGRR